MLELKIGERTLYMENISEVLEICRNSKNIFIDIPIGWKGIGQHLCRYISKNVNCSKIVLSGRPCWGSCDITLEMVCRYDTIIHVGHYLPPNIENVIRMNVDRIVKEKLNDTTILRVRYRDFESTVIYCQVYYKMNDVDIEKLDKLLSKDAISSEVAILCTPQYRDYAKYIAEKLNIDKISYITGCYVPKLNRDSRLVIICEGYFHVLTPLLYGYDIDNIVGIDISRMCITSKSHVENVYKRLILMKLKSIMDAEKTSNIVIMISQKLGQRRTYIISNLLNKLHSRYSTCIIELDDVNLEVLCSYRDCAYINTMCPRLALDDLDRFQVPIVNPGEVEYIIREKSLDKYNISDMLRTVILEDAI